MTIKGRMELRYEKLLTDFTAMQSYAVPKLQSTSTTHANNIFTLQSFNATLYVFLKNTFIKIKEKKLLCNCIDGEEILYLHCEYIEK